MKENLTTTEGKTTIAGIINCQTVAQGAVKDIGLDSFVDDLCSVESKGLNDVRVVAAAATFACTVKELLKDKLRYTIIDTQDTRTPSST